LKLRYVLGICCWLWLCLAAWAGVPPDSQQMIRVITPDWQAVQGRLQRFERAHAASPWRPVGQPVQIVVGRQGLGWGRGRFQAADTNGDFRREGDSRAPAGVFDLGTVFGLATEPQARRWLSLNMPYLHLNPSIRCIGDSRSRHYNELVDLRRVQADWTKPQANENMRVDAIRDEGAYRWGIFVNHNHPDNPVGMQRDTVSGSCIFLHIWKGPAVGTSGCTAMSKADLLDLINWLDQRKQPVLVQLPQAVYLEKQALWQLPLLAE